ncbi:hypothetical protein KHS38_11795 [Mucilaginibacter sp. Bleaf8]|uniref:hypothetical protein n=1 Tax=Mucilaginibacter sp. Bleaf8 TaxID=2834430 RepID=UPI001BCB531B|nr:hypothetical protein [Mucilaginibacter sp. Bleaf8]MBS7565088.1 hypothetical protein [Mucilaginibacter sp. Bleaf8]
MMKNRASLPRKKITRNLMQYLVRTAKQPVKVVEGGRGVGKSTVLADEIVDVVHDMPQSTNFLQGATFQQILTRTLPSTIESLRTLGYEKDIHYKVCCKPDKKLRWKEAFEPPLDYGRAIPFYNGSVYLLLSQDTNSRGLNTCSGIADEFALLDPVQFQAETLATIRGQKHRFEKCRRYRNQTYTSSIPRTQLGKFMYKYQEEAQVSPEKVFYVRASSHINKANLPAGWFEDQKRIMTKYEYDIEINNIRPKALGGGFYPLFNEQMHTYTAYNNDYLAGLLDNDGTYNVNTFNNLDCRQDKDWYPNAPLDIALDYGKFNCIVTGQETMNIFRFISAFSVESPKLTEDLVNQWCDYYEFHVDKTVTYWYDQTAVGRDGRTPKTYAEIVVETLDKRGWTVYEEYYGAAPTHVDKYNFWNIALRNNDPSLPHFAWNKNNAKYLIESINNAAAKDGLKGIEKVKTDEKNPHLDQRYTTHFSDAGDMLAYFKYAHNLSSSGLWLPSHLLKSK